MDVSVSRFSCRYVKTVTDDNSQTIIKNPISEAIFEVESKEEGKEPVKYYWSTELGKTEKYPIKVEKLGDKVDIADLAHLKMYILDSRVKLGSQD